MFCTWETNKEIGDYRTCNNYLGLRFPCYAKLRKIFDNIFSHRALSSFQVPNRHHPTTSVSSLPSCNIHVASPPSFPHPSTTNAPSNQIVLCMSFVPSWSHLCLAFVTFSFDNCFDRSCCSSLFTPLAIRKASVHQLLIITFSFPLDLQHISSIV